jgi:hypothetical protein
LRVSARLLIIEILAFLAFAILATAGLLAWRLSQGPIDLEMFRGQVEHSLAEARGGQPVKIQNLALEWVRDRGRVEAVARGFTAMDKDNQVTFRADRAMIALDAGALFGFKLKAQQLRLENGTATVVRSADGVWTLADMVIAKEPDASDKPFDPIRDINWTTLATPIRALISAGSFEQVELANFRLDVEDLKSNNRWSANPVAGIWKANREGVSLTMDITLADAIAGEPNKISIALASDGKVERAAATLKMEGVDPVSIAEMFGYTGDAFTSGRPASAAFSVSATERSGLLSTSLSLSGVTGNVLIADQNVEVKDLAFDASYDPASKKVTLKSLSVASDWLSGQFTGELDATAIMNGEVAPTPFTLAGLGVTINAQPVFEKPWQFDMANMQGALSLDEQKITLTKLEATTGDMKASATGAVWLDTKGETPLVGIKGNATGAGVITPQQVLDFWPQHLSVQARQWVRERITKGTANKAIFSIDWPPGANSRGFLPDEHLALEFHVEDATVLVINDLPAITGINGVGHLKGNSLTFDATSGDMAGLQVGEAKVVLPQFAPGGAMMEITASGTGQLGSLLRAVDQSQFGFGSRYGVDVSQIAGVGAIDVLVRQPMIDVVKPEDVIYDIKGRYQQVVMPDLLGEFGLSDANLTFQLDPKGIVATGAGQFGPAPVTFEWRERVSPTGDGGVELIAKARATPDLLNSFGLAARNFMQGEAVVELRATGPGGRDFDSISANVDLTHAEIEVAEFGWRKKFDEPARGTFRYGADGDGSIITGDIRADGLELVGEARMNKDSVVQGVDVERMYSRDTVDLRGTATRRQDGGYRVAMTGPFLDASPWMDGILDMSSGKNGVSDAVGGPGDPGPLFDVSVNADRLKLREDAEIRNTKIALAIDAEGPRSGTIAGEIAKGKNVNVTLGTTNGVRNIGFKSDDAGWAARVLLKADYLLGGKLAFDGRFEGEDGQALVTMSDVRLKDAPLVAKLFSIASLQGLADVLNGEGVMFTEVHAPVKFVGGRIDLPGMRATGPAMGLTARGWIAPESGELSLDGVLAPSIVGANAVLGALPIIGDLFVSRQGEGMFAPTYSVRGTFARANISINPIAALTPGVLRRIFENPAEPPPPSDTASAN